ncbi:citrate synthase-like protein [Thamnocephalis sphaerospora]|uniref:Citrate synthase n=1 Tax=Thamnocephalis sphaerospora TaxID=78915 RepID=A0A4P9XWG3_9FUNG|nr:citrate synthase-like protein [Thamnocephalis sphaerospora]|eukprot:RKP10382.1 citrate synthase-like protein [Thamnocephalis sphaerospora]
MNSGKPQSQQAKAANGRSASGFTLKEKQTGRSWELDAPGTDQRPVTFAVVPGGNDPQSLTVLDNRTNKIYTVPIVNNTISALKFKEMVADPRPDARPEDESDQGLRVYDPAFQNTAVAKSKITYIDGDNGILRYRGYPIEELAEKSNFLEVSYLLIYGELPSKEQFTHFAHEVMHHTFLHVKVTELMSSFNYDAHPMGMFISGLAAMSTFHPEANPALNSSDMYVRDERIRNKQILRLLGKVPTLAAVAYRHRIGRAFNTPQKGLSYTENFLYMMDHLSEANYRPNPKLAHALDVLFILHADHELNCSTAAMRHIGSSRVDPYSAIAGASSALYGPLHGGANEAVLRMLEEIKTADAVPGFLEQVKQRKKKLMGFGHRVYKNYDPRAKIIRQIAYEVFEICGNEPLIEVAIELERAALADEYFVKRRLYPNVDFYSGLIYKAMGFPTDFFPVLFAIPRVAGWLAHWVEACKDPDTKIWRPRQVYEGEGKRGYVPIEHRNQAADAGFVQSTPRNPFSKRSTVASYDNEPTDVRAKI